MRTVTVRTDRGRLHVAMPIRNTYFTACGGALTGLGGRDLFVYVGRDRERSWALELVCAKCDAKLQKSGSLRALAKACGW